MRFKNGMSMSFLSRLLLLFYGLITSIFYLILMEAGLGLFATLVLVGMSLLFGYFAKKSFVFWLFGFISGYIFFCTIIRHTFFDMLLPGSSLCESLAGIGIFFAMPVFGLFPYILAALFKEFLTKFLAKRKQ